ncbi:MAG: gfo/Idh/MocA family oxidoreductase [Nitrospirae bacterium]|nr:MAG: gfo/Idh/MocA family oxidoreductase [Nitrospirota bacterium]
MGILKVGLIGLGRHGMRYARHLLAPHPPAKLVAVCRRNAQEGLAFAQAHHLRFYQDPHALIADPDIDAVLVVTVPSLNVTIAEDAIRRRKPLLIEKPLTVTAQEARRLTELATRASVPVMTAHTLRYDAAIGELKAHAPLLGPWRYLVLTARMEHRPHSSEEVRAWNGRGALLEIGIHLLDLVRFMTGERVREVNCELERPVPGAPEDRGWVRLTTTSARVCMVDVSRVSGTRTTRVEIVGEHGQGLADWSASTVQLRTRSGETLSRTLPPTPTIVSVIQAFCHAVETGATMPITAYDGWRAVELAEACYRSAERGHPVQLPREDERDD